MTSLVDFSAALAAANAGVQMALNTKRALEQDLINAHAPCLIGETIGGFISASGKPCVFKVKGFNVEYRENGALVYGIRAYGYKLNKQGVESNISAYIYRYF